MLSLTQDDDLEDATDAKPFPGETATRDMRIRSAYELVDGVEEKERAISDEWIPLIVKIAVDRAMTENNIKAGFRKAGIWPVCPAAAFEWVPITETEDEAAGGRDDEQATGGANLDDVDQYLKPLHHMAEVIKSGPSVGLTIEATCSPTVQPGASAPGSSSASSSSSAPTPRDQRASRRSSRGTPAVKLCDIGFNSPGSTFLEEAIAIEKECREKTNMDLERRQLKLGGTMKCMRQTISVVAAEGARQYANRCSAREEFKDGSKYSLVVAEDAADGQAKAVIARAGKKQAKASAESEKHAAQVAANKELRAKIDAQGKDNAKLKRRALDAEKRLAEKKREARQLQKQNRALQEQVREMRRMLTGDKRRRPTVDDVSNKKGVDGDRGQLSNDTGEKRASKRHRWASARVREAALAEMDTNSKST